jgi:hypothetical protein
MQRLVAGDTSFQGGKKAGPGARFVDGLPVVSDNDAAMHSICHRPSSLYWRARTRSLLGRQRCVRTVRRLLPPGGATAVWISSRGPASDPAWRRHRAFRSIVCRFRYIEASSHAPLDVVVLAADTDSRMVIVSRDIDHALVGRLA